MCWNEQIVNLQAVFASLSILIGVLNRQLISVSKYVTSPRLYIIIVQMDSPIGWMQQMHTIPNAGLLCVPWDTND